MIHALTSWHKSSSLLNIGSTFLRSSISSSAWSNLQKNLRKCYIRHVKLKKANLNHKSLTTKLQLKKKLSKNFCFERVPTCASSLRYLNKSGKF